MPHRSSIPLFWRLKKGKYTLVGNRCNSCGVVYFPARVVCQSCGRSGLEEHKLPETGKIITYTIIHVAPEGFEAPYCVGIVELGDGVTISGHVVGDLTKIAAGSGVRVIFRKIFETPDGLINYSFKFELVD